MRLAILLALTLCALAAWSVPRLSRALAPPAATRMLTCTTAVAAAVWVGALALLAFAGLAHVRALADLGPWSVSFLRERDPITVPLAAVAGTVLTACLLRCAVGAGRRGRVLASVRRTTSHLPHDGELVIADDERPQAFALPGRTPRVLVSTAMLRLLEPDEWEALLAHERSHLRHRHHIHLHLLHLAARLCPLAVPLAHEGEYALERWADEDAAHAVGDRTVLASALARAALATRPFPAAPAATGGPVPRRVRALLNQQAARPKTRTASLLATVLLLVLAVASLGRATAVTTALLAKAEHTYSVRHCGGRPCSDAD